MKNIVKTTTPHAAVMVWNFDDRLGTEDTQTSQLTNVSEVIISTVSLVGISTSKSKGEPTGRFTLTLAPTKNWVSTLTAGSWICIMMSQDAFKKEDFTLANPQKVKMIGKIESVRLDVSADPETGARATNYVVSGVDWGHIFENFVYMDPFIEPNNNTVGAATYIDLFNRVQGTDGNPEIRTTTQNITSILQVIGVPLGKSFIEAGEVNNRVAKVDFKFIMPDKMRRFFRFVQKGKESTTNNVVDAIQLYAGKLKSEDTYQDTAESSGFIDPASFKGVNTLWQLIIDNANPVLNETFCDIRWDKNGRPTLALYNRIKPFIFRGKSQTQTRINKALSKESFGASKQTSNKKAEEITGEVANIMSQFQFLKTHTIPKEDVLTINAGTNWRDKFNFVEIKPNFQAFDVLSSWAKTVAQSADVKAFQREGFRPLIMATRQFPSKGSKGQQNSLSIDIDYLAGWKQLLREWHFDTHRLLNGTMRIIGQNNYIQVGDNIMVDMEVLGQTTNMNAGAVAEQVGFMLAHVEEIQHTFTVNPENGARSFITTISFVRGILVDQNKKLIGEGKLDGKASDILPVNDKNTANVIATSTEMDPDPTGKLRGT